MRFTDAADQELTIETIVGPKTYKAPGGWEFTKPDKIVWMKLLKVTKEYNEGKVTMRKKDLHAKNEVAEELASVLSSSLGMTAFYWVHEALRIGGTSA